MFWPNVAPWEERTDEVDDVGSVAGSGDEIVGIFFV